MMRCWAAALWLVAGLGYLVTEAVVAAHVPGYSYSADFISDLGKPMYSPMAGWMNGAFIAQGVAFAVAGTLVCTTVRRGPVTTAFRSLAVAYGVGTTMVGLIHGGGGGFAQTVHVAGAVAAIVGGNLAVLAAGIELLRRRSGAGMGITSVAFGSVALGLTGLVCGALVLIDGGADVVPFGGGFWERGAVYPIIGWQLLAGALIVRKRHDPDAGVQ